MSISILIDSVIQLWPLDTRQASRLMQHTTSITNISHWLSLHIRLPHPSVPSSPARRQGDGATRDLEGGGWGVIATRSSTIDIRFYFHLFALVLSPRNAKLGVPYRLTHSREGVMEGEPAAARCWCVSSCGCRAA